jgi:hypothetical protein
MWPATIAHRPSPRSMQPRQSAAQKLLGSLGARLHRWFVGRAQRLPPSRIPAVISAGIGALRFA